jgi:hypothetical protein
MGFGLFPVVDHCPAELPGTVGRFDAEPLEQVRLVLDRRTALPRVRRHDLAAGVARRASRVSFVRRPPRRRR